MPASYSTPNGRILRNPPPGSNDYLAAMTRLRGSNLPSQKLDLFLRGQWNQLGGLEIVGNLVSFAVRANVVVDPQDGFKAPGWFEIHPRGDR